MTTSGPADRSVITIGPLNSVPGTKIRGAVRADLGRIAVDIPVTLVNGTGPGHRVVITAGVHGGEFPGIDAAHTLAAWLEPGDLRGQVIICPVANPSAVYQGRLGSSPLDGVNINRVFPGDPGGSPTERLAAWLFGTLLAGADAYVDLHSGAIDETLRDFVSYRLSGDPVVDARSRKMACALGIQDLILGLSRADAGNSHAAAARQGISAVLVETGQLGERAPAAARSLLDALHRLLEALGVLSDHAAAGPATASVREWVWAGAVSATATGLCTPSSPPATMSRAARSSATSSIRPTAERTRSPQPRAEGSSTACTASPSLPAPSWPRSPHPDPPAPDRRAARRVGGPYALPARTSRSVAAKASGAPV